MSFIASWKEIIIKNKIHKIQTPLLGGNSSSPCRFLPMGECKECNSDSFASLLFHQQKR